MQVKLHVRLDLHTRFKLLLWLRLVLGARFLRVHLLLGVVVGMWYIKRLNMCDLRNVNTGLAKEQENLEYMESR